MDKNQIKTILVAENDEQIATNLIDLIRFNKFNVGWVQDCDTLFDALSERNVDLILIDLELAYSTKLFLINRIKALAPDLEIIIMTNFSKPELLNQALLSGASGFVQKPINNEQVLLIINKTLEKQWLKKENFQLIFELAIIQNSLNQNIRNQ